MRTKEARERVRARFDKWCLDEEDLSALQELGLVPIEGEDEKIRKEIIGYLTHRAEVTVFISESEDCKRWASYLERQKEYVSNNFDEVWEREDCSEIIDAGEKLSPRFKELFKEVCHAWYDKGIELEKKNPANDVYPKKLKDAIKLYYETYGNGKGGFDYMSYTKFEDIVKTFVNDYGCQKPAEWSEKDNEMLKIIDRALFKASANFGLGNIRCPYDDARDWFKFLPERFNLQPHWKPSEEQIEALEWMLTTVSFKDGGYGVVLKNLIDDLKKQM